LQILKFECVVIMEDMICTNCGNMVTPEQETDREYGLYDYVKFYCPKCGKEL